MPPCQVESRKDHPGLSVRIGHQLTQGPSMGRGRSWPDWLARSACLPSDREPLEGCPPRGEILTHWTRRAEDGERSSFTTCSFPSAVGAVSSIAVTTFIKLTSDNNGNPLWLDWHRIVYLYQDEIEDHRENRRVTVLVIQDLEDDLWVRESPEQIVAMVEAGARGLDWLDSTR